MASYIILMSDFGISMLGQIDPSCVYRFRNGIYSSLCSELAVRYEFAAPRLLTLVSRFATCTQDFEDGYGEIVGRDELF